MSVHEDWRRIKSEHRREDLDRTFRRAAIVLGLLVLVDVVALVCLTGCAYERWRH